MTSDIEALSSGIYLSVRGCSTYRQAQPRCACARWRSGCGAAATSSWLPGWPTRPVAAGTRCTSGIPLSVAETLRPAGKWRRCGRHQLRERLWELRARGSLLLTSWLVLEGSACIRGCRVSRTPLRHLFLLLFFVCAQRTVKRKSGFAGDLRLRLRFLGILIVATPWRRPGR